LTLASPGARVASVSDRQGENDGVLDQVCRCRDGLPRFVHKQRRKKNSSRTSSCTRARPIPTSTSNPSRSRRSSRAQTKSSIRRGGLQTVHVGCSGRLSRQRGYVTKPVRSGRESGRLCFAMPMCPASGQTVTRARGIGPRSRGPRSSGTGLRESSGGSISPASTPDPEHVRQSRALSRPLEGPAVVPPLEPRGLRRLSSLRTGCAPLRGCRRPQ
jgi:hypothetical protein